MYGVNLTLIPKCSSDIRLQLEVFHVSVKSENVTAKKGEPANMYCKIFGFDQNPPAYEYAWYYDELFIPRDHPRYYMTKLNDTTGISLKIKEPCEY